MNSDRASIIPGYERDKEETSTLDKSIAEDSDSGTLDLSELSHALAEGDEAEEKLQPGPSSVVDVKKAKFTPGPITAEVVIFDAAGHRKKSAADVSKNEVPSSSLGNTNAGNEDHKKPTGEIVDLDRSTISLEFQVQELSTDPIHRQNQALLTTAIYLFKIELLTQAVAGTIGAIGLVLRNQKPFFTENVWQFAGLFGVALLSLIPEITFCWGRNTEQLKSQFLQCLVFPSFLCWCVNVFIVARVLVYALLSLLLGSVWLTTTGCILTLFVSIPSLCVMCGGRLILE